MSRVYPIDVLTPRQLAFVLSHRRSAAPLAQ